ncbi:MAG: hypothetical protein QM679_10800 [Patulibacter sp.]
MSGAVSYIAYGVTLSAASWLATAAAVGPRRHWPALGVAATTVVGLSWTLTPWDASISGEGVLAAYLQLLAVVDRLAADVRLPFAIDVRIDDGLLLSAEQTTALQAALLRHLTNVVRHAPSVLSALAAVRPLRLGPVDAVSLGRAVAALRREPSIAVAAELSVAEHALLLATWGYVEAARSERKVGAPSAGQADEELEWAVRQVLCRVDLRRVPGAPDELVMAQRMLAAAAAAIACAERDALFHPQARAAAALIAAERAWVRPSGGAACASGDGDLPRGAAAPLSELGYDGAGRLTWRGCTADELRASGSAHPPLALTELTRAIDGALLACAAAAPPENGAV